MNKPIEWDELTKNGKPKATYINTHIALKEMGVWGSVSCRGQHPNTERFVEYYLPERDCYLEGNQALAILRDAIIKNFKFDPGKKCLDEVLEGIKQDLYLKDRIPKPKLQITQPTC